MTCQCPSCQSVSHTSSCAVHNSPAMPGGGCTCGAWADEEAETLFPYKALTSPQDLIFEERKKTIAAALRAAHKRGMVEGLKDARLIASMHMAPGQFISARIAELESQ